MTSVAAIAKAIWPTPSAVPKFAAPAAAAIAATAAKAPSAIPMSVRVATALG